MYFLQDNKIGLRPIQMSDVNETYLSWMNDPLVLKGLAGGMFPTTLADLEKFVQGVLSSKNDLMFAICDIATGKHIATSNLVTLTGSTGMLI